MTSESLPKLIVLPDAWTTITTELDRAAREGLARCGAPDEAVFVPLCALVHRPESLRAPRLERTELADLAAIVVADACIPPRELVQLSALRIRFRVAAGGGWDEAQARIDGLIDAALARHGRLDVLARGHSHPFDVGGTHPSGTDCVEHLAPCLAYNRSLGLNAGFTFIAVRAHRDVSNNGSDCGPRAWALHGFATIGEDVIDLGLAESPAENGAYARLLDAPFYLTPEGQGLESKLREELHPAAGEDARPTSPADNLRIVRLPLGWSRYRIAGETGADSILALPPDFPAAIGRRFDRGDEGWCAQDVIDWRALLPLNEVAGC